MPKMWDLLRKSKYYLINAHPLGQFSFPNTPKRIVNIGGIEVEMEGILNKIEEEKRLIEKEKNKGKTTMVEDSVYNWIKKTDCFVLFCWVGDVTLNGFTSKHLDELISTFLKFDKCRFVIHGIYPPLHSFSWGSRRHIQKNIYFYNFAIDQQKFLGKILLMGRFHLEIHPPLLCKYLLKLTISNSRLFIKKYKIKYL
ncbi:unnamed protein product [Meloidogyne enterolobii]|uniref:Uncharacterized protein n=1 Tax=Meloidogyne enterolobii TaxID=390850 RepID=A0ACB1AQN2_MELEN